MAAFSAITEDITEGIKDIVVNDPMGDNVAVTTPTVDLPTGVVGDAVVHATLDGAQRHLRNGFHKDSTFAMSLPLTFWAMS